MDECLTEQNKKSIHKDVNLGTDPSTSAREGKSRRSQWDTSVIQTAERTGAHMGELVGNQTVGTKCTPRYFVSTHLHLCLQKILRYD
jgi:hypothetical protein